MAPLRTIAGLIGDTKHACVSQSTSFFPLKITSTPGGWCWDTLTEWGPTFQQDPKSSVCWSRLQPPRMQLTVQESCSDEPADRVELQPMNPKAALNWSVFKVFAHTTHMVMSKLAWRDFQSPKYVISLLWRKGNPPSPLAYECRDV